MKCAYCGHECDEPRPVLTEALCWQCWQQRAGAQWVVSPFEVLVSMLTLSW